MLLVSSSGDYHPWVDLGSWNVTAPTTQTRIFSSPGTYTWTAPTGVTSVQAEAWGPGGNGANGAYFWPLYISGGGGGGGAYAKKSSVSVTPGQQYSIVVGAAGSTTKTSFAGTTVAADYGGNGALALGPTYPGIGGPGGQAANSTGDVKQSGGSGGGALSPAGGYGGGGGNGGAGGLGGQGSPNGNGYPGRSPGGGGGGAAVGAVQYYGGPGGNGQLVLTYGGPSTTTYSITGIVTSYYTGLGGVTIALTGSQSATVTTDAYGNFWFFNLPAGGTYTVTASMSGYSLSAPQTFTNLSADQYAYFTAIPTTTYYTLTTTVTTPNWGSISPSCPVGCSYSSGTQVAITAVPNSGYQLATFSGVDSTASSTGYVMMNSNRSVAVTFTPISTSYTLTTTASPSGGGTVSPSCLGGCSYSSGSQVTITAHANSGYQFSGWTGVDSSSGSTGYVTMNSNRSVTASFTQTSGSGADFTISASPSPQTVSPPGGAQYTIQTHPSGGFSGSISLQLGSLPSGSTASFSANPVQAGQSSVLTLTTGASTPPATYYIGVTGTSGGITRGTAAVLAIVAASPANMISPAGGAILPSGPLAFTWDPGAGVAQYQLTLGSSPEASDYFSGTQGPSASAYCPDGTLRCHSTTVTVPTAGQPQTVYASLGSLIGGSWQKIQYNYRIGISPPAAGSSALIPQAQGGSPAGTYSLTNNNQAASLGPYFAQDCVNGYCFPIDAGYVASCSVSGYHVTAGAISVPSQEYPDDYTTFDVAVTADYSAASGSRTLTCTVPGLQPGSADITVYDATPQIDGVYQYPPDYPGGPFYVSLYGTNFGPPPPGGQIAVCAPANSSNCSAGTPEITVSLNALYATWSDQQINALLTPSQKAAGDYLLQITSSGELGLGFAQAPQGQTNAQSNFGKVTVGPNLVSLTLTRQSLLQVAATGTPSEGQYSTQINGLMAADQSGIGNPVQLDYNNTTVTPSGAVIAFKDPANPNPNGSPAQGGIALIDTIYVAPSGASALKTYSIPTFGMSCYFTALQNDYSCSGSATTTNPPNIEGTFCNSFLSAVRLQGAGVLNNGKFIQYDVGSRTYRSPDQINGSDGPLIAGKTVARDFAIVPRYSNTIISLDGLGDVQATDTGALNSPGGVLDRIAGYRLDLYNGAGTSACANYPNPILVSGCTPSLPACPGQAIQ